MWWLFVFVIILFLAISPAIPIWIAERIFGQKLDMGNSDSIIVQLPWFLFYTIPVGAVVELLWIIRGIVYLIWGV